MYIWMTYLNQCFYFEITFNPLTPKLQCCHFIETLREKQLYFIIILFSEGLFIFARNKIAKFNKLICDPKLP